MKASYFWLDSIIDGFSPGSGEWEGKSWPLRSALVVRSGQYFSLNLFLTLTPTLNLFPTLPLTLNLSLTVRGRQLGQARLG